MPVPLLFALAVAAAAPPRRVLFVISAAARITLADEKEMECGFWAGEVATPARALKAAGFVVEVATPGGRPPVPDPNSLGGTSPEQLVRELPALEKPMKLESLSPARAADYAAIVIPGGYSPMVDLAGSKELGALLRAAMERKIIVAAICHGPAAFLAARDGKDWPFRGKKMTSFTNGEEDAWLRGRKLPWTVESALEKEGVSWSGADIWQSHVVRDGNLLTGQSSPSTAEFTRALLDALR